MKKPVILFVLKIIWLLSDLHKFLLKGISGQNYDYKTLSRVTNTNLKYLTNIVDYNYY